jgi:putative membrane-bound dehydrogenase-like protein
MRLLVPFTLGAHSIAPLLALVFPTELIHAQISTTPAPAHGPVPAPEPIPSNTISVRQMIVRAQNYFSPPELIPVDMLSVPEGFEVTLWAKSPMFNNPTNMDIDAQGRIWITEGVNYRRNATRAPAGDKITVLSDTDGDGRADSSYTFVQEPGLIAPLGMAVIDNRIFVSNAPDLIVYTDVDRDGKFNLATDKREVLLTGFNGRNHDHSLHSVTFGPDGLLYFSQGNCGALFTDRSNRTFRVGSPYDPAIIDRAPVIFNWRPPQIAGAKSDDGHVYIGGFTVRMQPDATKVEIIGHNFRNSYEQTITSFGDVFQNDNDDPPACRTSFLIEHGNLGFASFDGKRTWKADRRPGQSIPTAEWRQEDPHTIPAGDVYGGGSPTGIVSYEGDTFGEKWRGLLLSAEPSRNVVFGYFPKTEGAGYDLERFDFITSNKEKKFAGVDFKGGADSVSSDLKTYFRPADVAVGPDGAIYVADWFDPRVGSHRDLDERTVGAIYRIAPKGFKSVVPKFDLATTSGQIAALKSPAVNVRASGFIPLKAAGAASVPAVAALLTDSNPFIRARAIFLLAQLGTKGVALVEEQLASSDAQTRVAAYRALRRANQPFLGHAAKLATDSSAAVRREVATSLRDVPFAAARDTLLALAQGYDGKDRAYLAAWGIGATNKEADLYAALAAAQIEKDPLKWSSSHADLVWRLTPADAAPAFAARASSATLPYSARLAALTALGFTPTRDAAFAVLDLAQKAKGKLQATALWWTLNYKDSRWSAFGLNPELKSRSLYDPEKIILTASVVPSPPPTQLPPVAEIAALKGDATRGAAFAATCYICHRIGGNGIDYAPDLTGFASRQTTEVVINSIANPSTDIAHGYEGTEYILHDGTVIHGLTLTSGDPVIVQSMGGINQMIPAAKIKSRQRLNRSLMLSGEQLGLNAQAVADLVAYLKTQ